MSISNVFGRKIVHTNKASEFCAIPYPAAAHLAQNRTVLSNFSLYCAHIFLQYISSTPSALAYFPVLKLISNVVTYSSSCDESLQIFCRSPEVVYISTQNVDRHAKCAIRATVITLELAWHIFVSSLPLLEQFSCEKEFGGASSCNGGLVTLELNIQHI